MARYDATNKYRSAASAPRWRKALAGSANAPYRRCALHNRLAGRHGKGIGGATRLAPTLNQNLSHPQPCTSTARAIYLTIYLDGRWMPAATIGKRPHWDSSADAAVTTTSGPFVGFPATSAASSRAGISQILLRCASSTRWTNRLWRR